MKLLIVTAHLPYGANEAFIIPEIEELVRRGHQLLLVPRSPGGPLVHAQHLSSSACATALLSPRVLFAFALHCVRHPLQILSAAALALGSRSRFLDLKNLAVLPKAVWLAALASRWGADHIHCHWASTTATLALLASRLSGIPWSLTLHRWDIVENNILQRKLRHAAFARFISSDGLVLAAAAGVSHPSRAFVLGMGVAIPALPPVLSPQPAIVVCPARLVPVKGHRYLIDAWRRLRLQGLDAELWLAGDGEERPRLEALARAFSLGTSVRFLGTVPHGTLLDLYSSGRVAAVVLPSVDLGSGNHEGVPVALVEAMSYAIPVVATATGAIPELLLPGTGLTVPPQSPADLFYALSDLLADPHHARSLGLLGRRRVMQVHDVRNVARELIHAFRRASPSVSSHASPSLPLPPLEARRRA